MLRRLLHVLALILVAVVGTACRVDVAVDVRVAEDGTGEVTVTATADADVVAAAPGLAQDLRFDDVAAAGWTVTGPSVTDDGGITVTITHTFATPAEATALLESLNGADGPFQDMALTRVEDEESVTYALSGVGRVDSGLLAFTDPDLFRAVGATPYADEIAAANLTPTQAIGLRLRVELPGTVGETTSDPELDELAWTVPLDGSSVPLSATSTLSLSDDAVWSIVATVLLVTLIVWIAAAALFIAAVVRARARRTARGRPLPPPFVRDHTDPSRRERDSSAR